MTLASVFLTCASAVSCRIVCDTFAECSSEVTENTFTGKTLYAAACATNELFFSQYQRFLHSVHRYLTQMCFQT